MSALHVFSQQQPNVIAASSNSNDNKSNPRPTGSFIHGTVTIVTKYGLRARMTATDTGPDEYTFDLISQTKPLAESENEQIPSTPSQDKQQPLSSKSFHYRIFPDWQTSYFWKNSKHLQDPKEDTDIEDEDIASWYPALAPFFFNWRETYEDNFEGQEMDLGAPNEVFVTPDRRVAWTVEGFLMCSWLALQPAVSSVEYLPNDRMYALTKESLSERAAEFFSEMDIQLNGAEA